jgi:hypothetical protein
MHRLRNEYLIEIVRNDESKRKIPLLCHYLNLSYLALGLRRTSVVLTDNVKQWQTDLREHSGHLAYLVYAGSSTSIEHIQKR